MKNQKSSMTFKNAARILFWLMVLALFVWSFQSIMNLQEAASPGRQESFLRILADFSQPNFLEGETVRQVAQGMWQTAQVAFLATVLSALLAIPFTVLIARPTSILERGLNVLLQPILSIIRSVHPFFLTVPLAVLAGIGPTAGVLALALFSTAMLVGSFSEYAQQQPSLKWGALITGYFPALAFKQLPVNMVTATVLGFVGGGGIGALLRQNLNLLNYADAGVALVACMLVIGSIDLISRAVWRNIQKNTKMMSPD